MSVKVAMAQLGGQPQLDLQMAIVKALKENGANTVEFVLKNFEVVERYIGKGSEKAKPLKNYYHKIIQLNSFL